MTGRANIPSLERITFFKGQRLTASDLSELQRAHKELRWLHNRALHGWGIGTGFVVAGETGDSAVTVEPGYGIDCKGREIILTKPRTLTVPAVAGHSEGDGTEYYLVTAYREDKEQTIAERRPGVCLPEGTVRLSEQPSIEWRRPDQVHEGHELILAQVWIRNCRLSVPLSLAVRRFARSAQQPYITAGQTGAGKTAWVPWKDGGEQLGVYADVETGSARFHTVPNYMAHVVGERNSGGNVVNGVASVVDPARDKFRLQVRTYIEQFSGDSPPQDLSEFVKDTLKWHVVWFGIEM